MSTLTKVQQVIHSEYLEGLTCEQIASKYALIPIYVERQLKEVEDKITLSKTKGLT